MRLGEVFPGLSSDYVGNSASIYVVSVSYTPMELSGKCSFSYLSYEHFVKFAVSMLAASRSGVPSFLMHVYHVLGLGSRPQVVWTAARGIVA